MSRIVIAKEYCSDMTAGMGPDRTDFEILATLQKDGRLTNKELAAQVGLAPSSCSVRVRQLREAGILKGARAEVEPRAVGIGLQAMIAVRLKLHAKGELAEFTAHAVGLREVVAVYHMAGPNDFLIHVAVRDADHLRQVAVEEFTARAEVEHMETGLIFEFHHTGGLPIYCGEGDTTIPRQA